MLLGLKFSSSFPIKLSTRLKKLVEVERLGVSIWFGFWTVSGFVQPSSSLKAPAIFGVGHGFLARRAVEIEFTLSPIAVISFCAVLITAGSGTQVVPACDPFSRWPS